MKIRLFAVLLIIALLFTACSNSGETPAGSQPDVSSTTQPTEGEEEVLDIFGTLYPKDGTIPRGKDIVEYVKTLADNTSRISEINYTWINGRPSMEIMAGSYDEYHTYESPAESPLQLIYNESEYYNYVLYLPDGYDPADTEKKWPVIFFFHGIGELLWQRRDNSDSMMDLFL